MSYSAYITKLKNVRPHPNADKLVLADCFGNTVCVPTSYTEGMIGVYFPTDGQVSAEFGEKNNLLRKKDDAGNSIGGYMDPEKRNVKAIRLRGEKSDGIFLPLTCLEYTGVDLSTLKVGDVITVVNGHEICKKYIPRGNRRTGTCGGKNGKASKKQAILSPTFAEHKDTEQLAYNLSAFRPGDEVEITLKMHGTSQRTGHLPVLTGYADPWYLKIFNRVCNYFGINKEIHKGEPIYGDYGYVSGTRRTVLEDFDGGYYGSNEFREQHSKVFENKLWKGETVYYEVVGFTTTGAPIMADANNAKLNDKEFVKKYGQTTVFSYGCAANPINSVEYFNDESLTDFEPDCPQSDMYVYRMTMTNVDGNVVEYTPEFMRYRCEQMGVKTVPVMWKGTIPDEEVFTGTSCEFTDAGEWILSKAEEFYDGPDPIGKTHIREGVVVRILNRPTFAAYKHKNFAFKCISGIIAESVANGDSAVDEEVLAEL